MVRDKTSRPHRETPPPRKVRVAGRLDMIEVSTQTFALELDTDERVQGVLRKGSVADVKMLVDRRVLVLGMAVYRPSGRVLRIDAEEIVSGQDEPSFWSRIPEPMRRTVHLREVRRRATIRSPAATIFGQWPGDETEKEILEALEKLS